MPAAVVKRKGFLIAASVGAIVAVILLENLGSGRLNRLLLYLPGVDKILHVVQSFLIFKVLTLVAGWTRLRRTGQTLAATAGTLVLAFFDEWQQQWVGDRSVEAADIAAGISGLLLALSMTVRIGRPRIAVAIAAAAVVLATSVTYASYERTKDYNRGLLAEERRDMKNARRHFLKALEGGHETAELLNYLAWTEVESGEGDASRAVAYAERSLALRPGNADTLDSYGWALHHAGRSQDALTPLNEALRRKPKIYCIHYHLGEAYLGIGDVDAARKHLRLQIESAPDTIEAERAAVVLRRLDGDATSR